MNPYAAPKARLQEVDDEPGVWRDGNLVCMDRSVELPDRCVACNETSGSRVVRKLYWSPRWWRVVAGVAPLALLSVALYGGQFWLLSYFWFLLAALIIMHLILRRSFKVALGACIRHRRIRYTLIVLSVGSMATMIVAFMNIRSGWATLALAIAGGATATLAAMQAYVGVQAVSAAHLTKKRAWLKGTGIGFRMSLPELPG